MRIRQIITIATLAISLLFLSEMATAQCAMCEAVAESASEENEDLGKGLNYGILYLMFIPYLLFALLGIIFFRKKIAYFYRELSNQH